MQAFSFIRWSRPEQSKGDTLRRQLKSSTSLCERNGWTFTELAPLRGRSAFRGKQRVTGPLAEFLKLAETGGVPQGSVLIVESLDRLTREDIRTAVKFFLSILDAGISIATTNPEYVFHHDGTNDLQDIMIAVVILSRGHEESATKSKRVRDAWAQKRIDRSKKLTATCPSWLRLAEDRSAFVVIEDKAEVVRRIFRMAVDGYGVFRITRHLNKMKTATIGRKSSKWYESYVIRILRNRAVIGEFQPCTRDGTKSKPFGEPIPGYYPPVVTDTDFQDARKAIESRALGCKRTGKNVPNVFGRLIRNARDHSGFLYIPAKKKAPHARLEPVGGRNGTCLPLSFRYAQVEAAFLKYLREVTPSDLIGKPKTESRADQLQARIEDLGSRIDVLKARLDTDDDLSFLFDRLAAWERERKLLVVELEAERHVTDEGATLQEAQSILGILDENPEHYRTKLRQLIHNIVSELWMLVYEYQIPGSRGRVKTERAAVLQVHFKAGHFRSIDIFVNEEIGVGAVEGRLSWEDLRHYRNSAVKRFESPVDLGWMLEMPALADKLKGAAEVTGHHPLDPLVFSHEFFPSDET